MTDSPAPRHALAGRLNSGEKSYRVTISHRDEEILVTILGDPGELFDGPLTELMLESTGGRGVLRTPGTGQRVDMKVLRFFLDDSASVDQRRQHVRIVAAERIVLESDEGDVLLDTYVANLSGGGALLAQRRSKPIPELPDRFYFELTLGDDGDPVLGTGRAIRKTEENQVAIAFEDVSRRDQDRLIKFIFDRQRQALKITRGDVA